MPSADAASGIIDGRPVQGGRVLPHASVAGPAAYASFLDVRDLAPKVLG